MWTFHIVRVIKTIVKVDRASYTDALFHLNHPTSKAALEEEPPTSDVSYTLNHFGEVAMQGRIDPGLMEALPVYYIANRLRLVGAVDPMEDYAVQWGTAIREYYEFLRTEPESTGLDAVEAYLQKKYPDLGTLPSGYNVNTSNAKP
jgi:hypothetical protein